MGMGGAHGVLEWWFKNLKIERKGAACIDDDDFHSGVVMGLFELKREHGSSMFCWVVARGGVRLYSKQKNGRKDNKEDVGGGSWCNDYVKLWVAIELDDCVGCSWPQWLVEGWYFNGHQIDGSRDGFASTEIGVAATIWDSDGSDCGQKNTVATKHEYDSRCNNLLVMVFLGQENENNINSCWVVARGGVRLYSKQKNERKDNKEDVGGGSWCNDYVKLWVAIELDDCVGCSWPQWLVEGWYFNGHQIDGSRDSFASVMPELSVEGIEAENLIIFFVAMNAEQQTLNAPSKGGWITFPFLIATMAGLTLAVGGWFNNMIVYLVNEFNVKSIDAAQIANIVVGYGSFISIGAAILADSFIGPFTVIFMSSMLSSVGLILLTLTATVDSLKPLPCENGSNLCVGPTHGQLAILYTSLALSLLGLSGTRFTLAAMGADQFDNPKHQEVFINWHIFTMFVGMLVSGVGIVYVEDNVSWGVGYGLCVASNIIGLGIFVLGKRYYRLLKTRSSPFTRLACVAVAAFRKRKVFLSSKSEDYMQDQGAQETEIIRTTPTNSLKFLNHAALVTDGDTTSDGFIKKPWNLCTIQQVEDLKTLIKISPLWSTGILLNTPITIMMGLVVLQALTMNRHLNHHIEIPAGSMTTIILLSSSISLALLEHLLLPAFRKLTSISLTPLQITGVGHALTISTMAIAALVESKRLAMARSHNLDGNSIVPMSVFWLVPQLALVGAAEAFHFPAQVSLYYQEFPKSLKSMAVAMVGTFVGIAFLLGTAVVDFLRRITGWLPNGINEGRIDNVYWVLSVFGLINFGYFLLCSLLYKCQNVAKEDLDRSSPS
ncbi:protein NRT1/ PTR FAMILY 2.7-like [Rutidosis leptorrhynchoides]|uniref:protein NRT1/ PTR FAMILY 2.7-like n=1 Tax=Rutidosis leptorrhynchoides TaxID=125765 RepID=UPI003A99F2B9